MSIMQNINKNKGNFYVDSGDNQTFSTPPKKNTKLTDTSDLQSSPKKIPCFLTAQKSSCGSRGQMAGGDESVTTTTYTNDYEFLEKLGDGSFGTVYKCRNKNDNNIYAVKVTKKMIVNQATKKLFLQEAIELARISDRFDQSNIVRYYNCWIDKGQFYLAMEYCNESLGATKKQVAGFDEKQLK